MKSFFNSVSAMILTAAVMLQGVFPVTAAEDDISSAVKGIVAVRSGSEFYLKQGKHIVYNEGSGYYPVAENGDVMIPVDMLKSILDFNCNYDKKRENAHITKNGKDINIRAGEDGVYINGTAKLLKTKARNTGKTLLIPFKEIANALGMDVEVIGSTGIIAASENQILESDISQIIKYMADDRSAIFTENFENGEWGYQVWNGAESQHGLEEDGNGGKAGWLGVTQKGFSGMLSQSITFDRSKQYRLTIDLKKSQDFKNQSLNINAWPYDINGKFLNYLTFMNQCGELSSPTNDEITTEWKTFSLILPKYAIPDTQYANLNNFQINIRLSKSGSEPATGKIYFDNIVLEEYTPSAEYVSCDLTADKYAAWYYQGDTVTFKANNANVLEAYSSIKSYVYNGDGELVFENEVKPKDIIEKGWSYTPEKLGYYEVKFEAMSSDGTIRPIVKSYVKSNLDNKSTRSLVDLYDDTYSFAIVKGEAKNMSERNDMLMVSTSPSQKNSVQYKLMDMLGVSGMRLHPMRWGDAYGYSGGIEKKRGEYTWTEQDAWLEALKEYEFKNVVANVFSTPEWAVAEKYRGTSLTGSGYIFQKMAPENMDDLANFVQEFYKHYKGKVDVLEFWNEPHYGNTAFWADTPEKLREMTKTAYTALRQVDPEGNMRLAASAWNQGYQLYRECISDEEYYNSFDDLSFHSRYGGDYREYTNADESYGYQSKPAFASEEYLYAHYTKGVPKDHNVNSMHFMATMMNHIKHGFKYITLFEICDNIPDEFRVWGQNNNTSISHVMGLFSPFPYLEPHKGAVIAYNLYENMGLEFKYMGEYDFGEGQKAVCFLNDGEPFLIVWNSEDKPFYLSDAIKDACTEITEITTFEGNSTHLDDLLKPLNMYYIKCLDKEKINTLEKCEDTALNDDYLAPYYTCEKPEFVPIGDYSTLDESKVKSIVTNSAKPPFDKDTFKLTDDVEWITEGWNWVTQNHQKPMGYAAKFAAHVDKEGFYLAVDVTDSVIHQPTDGDVLWDAHMYTCDSMQFAIDCLGSGDAQKRCEFQVGNREGKDVLFKQEAPDVEFNMLEGWHGDNTVLDPKYIKIEKTGKGIIYKIFLPMSEMYPFQYSDIVDHMRFSLLVNNNDGDGRSYYEWSSGIGGNKDPKLFGALKIR